MDPVPSATPARSSESGIVLVLALLVMLILIVVVTQIFHSSQVDLRRAENMATELQMEKLAEAAMQKAVAALISDLDEDIAAAQAQEEGDAPDSGGGSMMGGDGGGLPGAGGGEAHIDSLDEIWAMGDFPFELGEYAGLSTKIYIEDEDSKINLLLLAVEDEEYRLEWRDRMVRVLDLFREGQEDDLDQSEAEAILARFEEWMTGERESDFLSTAPLADGPFMDEETGTEFYAPLSLAELALAGGVDEPLLFGFNMGFDDEDKEWVPGISRVLTVFSNLEFDNAAVPPAPGEEDDLQAQPEDEEEDDSAADDEPEPEAPGVNNGRINVNTAPVKLLQALLSEDELPAATWDEYDEYRREFLEEMMENPEDFFGSDDEDDPSLEQGPIYPLESVEDLRRYDSFSESNSYLMPETWRKLSSLLTVESNVFTITVVVGTRTPPHRFYVARSVVWRRNGDDGAEVIPVLPFERLPAAAIDLSKFEQELEEEAEWGGFGDW